MRGNYPSLDRESAHRSLGRRRARRGRGTLVGCLCTAVALACGGVPALTDDGSASAPRARPAQESIPLPPSALPPADRIVAIGDLHGDLAAARRALRLAGAIDRSDRWIGGELVIVQVGDILDRGDDEQAILDLFHRLQTEARDAGGAIHVLNANHEMLNVDLDFRYVTDGGFADFEDAPGVAAALDSLLDAEDEEILDLPEEERARGAAFRPGGPYARILAGHPVALRIGNLVFVHGGLRPRYIRVGLDELNRQSHEWLLGEGPKPEWVSARKGPLWSRDYSDEVDEDDCLLLQKALRLLDCGRMIVGHTPHDDITPYCSERLWCVDCKLSEHYGGSTEVLEIRGDRVRILEE